MVPVIGIRRSSHQCSFFKYTGFAFPVPRIRFSSTQVSFSKCAGFGFPITRNRWGFVFSNPQDSFCSNQQDLFCQSLGFVSQFTGFVFTVHRICCFSSSQWSFFPVHRHRFFQSPRFVLLVIRVGFSSQQCLCCTVISVCVPVHRVRFSSL